MQKFNHLRNLLAMDFSTMRKHPCAGGHCASDSALRYFLMELHRFFSQFDSTDPTKEELRLYHEYMQKIARKINTSELIYFLNHNEVHHFDPEIEALLQSFQPSKPDTIMTKIMDWAASSRWEEAIRYVDACRSIAERMKQWSFSQAA